MYLTVTFMMTCQRYSYPLKYKTFRHVETLFVQGNQICTDQNKPTFLLIRKELCFDQDELDYLGRIKFLHVEMPYWDKVLTSR